MRLNFIHSCVLVSLSILVLPLNGRSYHRITINIMPPDKQEGKIVGGNPVPIEQFPSAALVFNMGSLCSATILNSWTALSAAHCFDHNRDVDYITIHVGARHRIDYKAEVHSVAFVETHKDYNKAMPFACDIALLFVTHAFDFRKNVQKAILVRSDSWMNEREKEFYVTGWGLLNYDGELSQVGLLMTNMQFISRLKCGKLHGLNLTDDMFCLYGDGVRDTCKGDSGGGVLWKELIVGVVSHGDGCAGKDKPSMYTNVFYFRNWIRNTIERYFKKHCSDKKRRQNRRQARRAENCPDVDIS